MNLIKRSLKLYVENKIPPGSFLLAVLRNDLRKACGRADYINKGRIFEIVEYCYNEIPSDCWGSPEAVKNWLSTDRTTEE